MAKSKVEIRPLQWADDREDFVSTVCDARYTPRYYGDTPRHVAERFLEKHFHPTRGPEATSGAEIWIGLEEGTVVGYYTTIFKRWGTAKGSTFVVKAEHQGRGLGRAFHAAVESAYDQREGLRKLFHTLPVKEAAHVRLSLQFGYRVEGHLRDHFIPGSDELVMGRRPLSWKPTAVVQPQISDRLLPGPTPHAFEVHSEAPHEHVPILREWLSAIYDGVDDAYAEFLLTPRSDRRVFVAMEAEEPTGFLLLSRKRIRLMKALVILDPEAPSRGAAEELFLWAIRTSREEGARKIFTEIPDRALQTRQVAHAVGFEREAVLASPYREGVDLVLLSRFLGGPPS